MAGHFEMLMDLVIRGWVGHRTRSGFNFFALCAIAPFFPEINPWCCNNEKLGDEDDNEGVLLLRIIIGVFSFRPAGLRFFNSSKRRKNPRAVR